jgi:flavin reductase (DIM6/NTAB) family NADH-FMN oxidoreductase RutF
MTVDPEVLRVAMRSWVTGITIVSTSHRGVQHGMTVSSFTSVSLEPPLLMVSLEQSTRTHELVGESGAFGVTILGDHQVWISDRFAGRESESSDRFAGLEVTTLVTGVPFLKDHLACFDCRVVRKLKMGNHTIFIGEVLALDLPDGKSLPLIYYDRSYRQLIR